MGTRRGTRCDRFIPSPRTAGNARGRRCLRRLTGDLRDRDCRRTRRPLAPGSPRSHNRRAMPGTTCSARDPTLQQSASSDAPPDRRESYRANHFKQSVFTRPGPIPDSCAVARLARSPRRVEARARRLFRPHADHVALRHHEFVGTVELAQRALDLGPDAGAFGVGGVHQQLRDLRQ